MLDLKYVTANAEAVKQNCRNRNVSTDVLEEVDRVVALELERKDLLQKVGRAGHPYKMRVLQSTVVIECVDLDLAIALRGDLQRLPALLGPGNGAA